MGWGFQLNYFTVASIALGLSVVCLQHFTGKKRSKINKIDCKMSEAAEIECSDNSVCQLATTTEQLKVSEKPESPQPPNDEIEIPYCDSANHSESSAETLHPDSTSENFNDSGELDSDCANNTIGDRRPMSCSEIILPLPTPRQPTTDVCVPMSEKQIYEFKVPKTICGLLIGKYGAFINQIKIKTGASMLIKENDQRTRLCSLKGTKTEVDAALSFIREKFPLKRYPQMSLIQTNCSREATHIQPALPDSIQLILPPGVTCDAMISAVVAPNHVFLQQINHPTYPSLSWLNHCMAECYNKFITPCLPRPIRPGMVCAAPFMGAWHRAKIVAIYPPSPYILKEEVITKPYVSQETAENQANSELPEIPQCEDDFEVDICFVDYGGYSRVMVSSLRQIRADCMTIPFQAIECLLANVAPLSSAEGWSAEAYAEVVKVAKSGVVRAQAVACSMESMMPVVYLYQVDQTDEPVVNKQLVNRGVAQWIQPY